MQSFIKGVSKYLHLFFSSKCLESKLQYRFQTQSWSECVSNPDKSVQNFRHFCVRNYPRYLYFKKQQISPAIQMPANAVLTKRERSRKYSEDCPAFSIAAPPRTVKRSVIKNRVGCCSPLHLQKSKKKFS